MNPKILSISDFVKSNPPKPAVTVAELRAQLAEADAIWPFSWY